MVHRITVIIPTQNRPGDLRQCLLGLQRNDTSLLEEVIIIDDGSVPPLAATDVPGLAVRMLRNATPQGAMASRNIAAGLVTTDVIAFLDDDAVPSPDWLTVIETELTRARGAVTGRVLRFDRDLVSRARQARYDKRYAGLTHGQPVTFFSGGNSAIWTERFRAVGGFLQTGSGGDNGLVADLARLGAEVVFIPELVILHRNSKGLWRAVMDAFRSGRHHPERLSLPEAIRRAVVSRSDLVGVGMAISALNWLLNLIHLIGRTAWFRE